MYAFLTGSRVYGVPNAESDIDLVIRVDSLTAQILKSMSDVRRELKEKDDDSPVVVRYGKLNLILCETDAQYCVWKLGTYKMSQCRQATGEKFNKEAAKEVFDVFRNLVGIEDSKESGNL